MHILRKIIKNISDTNQIVLGRVLAPQATWELPMCFWMKAADDTNGILANITAGKLIVNDGTCDLCVEDSISWLKVFAPDEDILRTFHFMVSQSPLLMNCNTWLFAFPISIGGSSGVGSYSGSDSGYKYAQPYIFPFRAKLKKASIVMEGGIYNNRAVAGSLFLSLGFYNHTRNSASLIASLDCELTGSFTGTSISGQTINKTVSSFNVLSGANDIPEGAIIGVQFRKDVNKAGQLSTIYYPHIGLLFEEIV